MKKQENNIEKSKKIRIDLKNDRKIITEYKKEVIVKDKEGNEFNLGIIDTRSLNVKVDKNFYKFWIPKFKKNSNKDSLIFVLWFYFIEKMQKTNKLIVNHIDLAKKYNTTRQTISNNIKKLVKLKLIKYKNQIVFVNPFVIWKGTHEKRNEVCKNYYQEIFID